jgi:hypothetical protein
MYLIKLSMNTIIKLDHKITYNDKNLFDKFNVKTYEEKQQIVNIIYKYDLICIFDLEDFFEDIINKRISELYELMSRNKEIKDVLNVVKTKLLNESNIFIHTNLDSTLDKELTCFITLFSYDNLHLFYPCICDFYNNDGIINIDKLEMLKNNIFKLYK